MVFKKSKGLKIIFGHLGKYKGDLIILSIFGVISAIANGVIPYIAGRFFDAILDPTKIFIGHKLEMSLWLFFIILYGIMRLVIDIVDWRIGVKGDRMGETLRSKYIIKSFGRLLELPILFHKKQKVGETTYKINRAASALLTVADRVIITLAPQFLGIFVAFVITFYINSVLAGVILFGVIFYAVILIKTAPNLARLSRKMHRSYSRAYGDSYDSIFNVQAVKQAVSEKHEQKKIFKAFWLRAFQLYLKVATGWRGLTFFQRLIVAFTQLSIFVLSVFFIQKGTMTLGQLLMFNGYAMMAFGPFIQLGHNWRIVQDSIIAVERGEKILAIPTEKYAPKHAVILEDIKGDIEFKNVNFTYERRQGSVLNDLSFKVKQGEVIALVGESGVGKSTLVDLISGYYFVQKGKVLIDGHNIKNLNLKFLRSRIAVVPQEVVLFNDTIKKNIAYGKFSASDEEIGAAAEKSYASEFIESFSKKYKQIVGERGVRLSVGQKQRVAIARAILRNPRVLVLDEPTSALDAKSEKFIQKSLEELMKGRTTFIIAHRLSTVRKADKILVLENGRIVEQGKHGELIKIPNGVYRQLYEFQIGLK